MNEFNLENIKLIIGLGNLGEEYKNTRHNAGFMFLDKISNNEFKEESKFHALISKKDQLILSKPTTMMNMSGITAFELKKYYKLKPKQIIVAYDDLDLEMGEFKLQYSKYPKIHNGLNSIIKYLGTDKFWNLRIGVDSRDDNQRKYMDGFEYVLKKINPDEMEILQKTFDTIQKTYFPI